MTNLAAKAIFGIVQALVIFGLALFGAAWTFHYWQAWLFLAVYFSGGVAIFGYLIRRDPELLARRLPGASSEKETVQQVIHTLIALAFLGLLVVSATDHRLGWSTIPVYGVVAGEAVVATGLFSLFLVCKSNSFLASTVEVQKEQTVVSTGPYAIVRHPMYAGSLIMLVGMPPALGSWWGMLAVVPMAFALVWRIIDEERILDTELSGYSEYRKSVKYRLVPGIW